MTTVPIFDDYYMEIARVVRRRANCLGSHVGAILVKDNRIISTGYNGTPRGFKNCLDGGCERCANRSAFGPGRGYDMCLCVHAEQNALLFAGLAANGATLYTTMQPCFSCLKDLRQSGVVRIVYDTPWEPRCPNDPELDAALKRSYHTLTIGIEMQSTS